MKASNLIFTRDKTEGTVALRYTSNMKFRLLRVEVKVDDTPTDSEDFTIVSRNVNHPEYDVIIYKRDLSVGSVTDLVIPFGDGYEHDVDDVVDIDYANTGGDLIAIRIVTLLLED